jgi:hypothetical protein
VTAITSVEDDLVLRDVEVDSANDLDDVGHGVFAQQHAAEGALFGQQVVRGNPVAVAASAFAPVRVSG